jgi:photosystem II stability/assembly factor-like uncharacterized protein
VLGQQTGSPVVVGQPAPRGIGDLNAVSCPDADHCWAVGVAPPATTDPVVAVTKNGGVQWSAQPLALPISPALTGISCPLPGQCVAVGSTGSNPPAGTVLTTHNGGSTWQATVAPVGALAVTSVWCSSGTSCVALVSDGTIFWTATTSNFGHAWTRAGNLPSGMEDPGALSCDAANTCLVAGNTATTAGHAQGAIAISADGGATWSPATVPAATGLLQSATCAGIAVCVAGGSSATTVNQVAPSQGALLSSGDGGHTWTTSAMVPPVDDIFGLACPSARVCAMVGTRWMSGVGVGAVALSANGGASFRRSSTAYTPLSLTAVACPTATACVAVGGDTVARISIAAPARKGSERRVGSR